MANKLEDYISRSSAINALCADCVDNGYCGDNAFDGRYGCEDVPKLLGVPAADVRPLILAQWIALDIYRSEGNYKCSNCKQPCYVPECMGDPMYSVCPNCGAKMEGADG